MSRTTKIILVVLILLAISSWLWYYFVYRKQLEILAASINSSDSYSGILPKSSALLSTVTYKDGIPETVVENKFSPSSNRQYSVIN